VLHDGRGDCAGSRGLDRQGVVGGKALVLSLPGTDSRQEARGIVGLGTRIDAGGCAQVRRSMAHRIG
jgi:hypothetical protein